MNRENEGVSKDGHEGQQANPYADILKQLHAYRQQILNEFGTDIEVGLAPELAKQLEEVRQRIINIESRSQILHDLGGTIQQTEDIEEMTFPPYQEMMDRCAKQPHQLSRAGQALAFLFAHHYSGKAVAGAAHYLQQLPVDEQEEFVFWVGAERDPIAAKTALEFIEHPKLVDVIISDGDANIAGHGKYPFLRTHC